MNQLDMGDVRVGGVYLLAAVLGVTFACYFLARFFDRRTFGRRRRRRYEPPKVTHMGNINDLLASTCSGGSDHEHHEEAPKEHGEVGP